MDLIYTNAKMEDIGVLQEYELDLAFGADENNFECTIQAASHCCEAGSFLYFEGTEYGGIIDSIQSNSNTQEVVYSGRTWHGILNSKVLQPDSGKDYLTVSGEANAVIADLLSRLALTDLFEASDEDSGLTISNYKMHRYITGYDGITKMLSTVDARIRVVFQKGKVILSAVNKYDYSKDEEFDSDQVIFNIRKNYKAVNHLICLGSGELADRLVVHLYVDKEGNISQTQTQFGLEEVSSIYEYSSVKTAEELIAAGMEQLEVLNASDEVSVDFDADSDTYDVGDVVGAYDNITGMYIAAVIAKKIVTIKNGKITISLTPDTAKAGSTKEVGGTAKIECVDSFNGRTGAVVPATGDYTADMVGARPDTWMPTAAMVGAVPTTRTVNGKALSSNITLAASDVGAMASAQHIEMLYDVSSNRLTDEGWYRILSFAANSYATTLLLNLRHTYNSGGPQSMTALVVLDAYVPTINIIGCTKRGTFQSITRLRIVKGSNGHMYLDFYKSGTQANVFATNVISMYYSLRTTFSGFAPVAETVDGETVVLNQEVSAVASG